jgi:hypothetical protein
MGLSSFSIISLIEKKRWDPSWRRKNNRFSIGISCRCECRLHVREHEIDLASSVERSIHCVWPRVCLDGVPSKINERKRKRRICINFDISISQILRCLSRRNWWVRALWGHDLFSSLPSLWRYFTSWVLTLSAFVRSFLFISHLRFLSHVLYFFPFRKSLLP